MEPAPLPEIIKTTAVAAPPCIVWRVLTNPKLIRCWMSDEPLDVSLDGRVGGMMLVTGLLHGTPFSNRGPVTAFEPERVFEYRYWSTLSRSHLAEAPENRSTVRFALQPRWPGVTLTLTLSDFPEPSIRPHADFYWGPTLRIIKALSEREATDASA